MKQISLLGSTGSIGTSTLEVIAIFPDRFSVTALAAKSNIDLLAEQIRKFRPALAVVYTKRHATDLRARLSFDIDVEILWGEAGYKTAAAHPPADVVVNAMVGAAGLGPTLAAIDAGKDIAFANKETLVMAGEIVMAGAAEKGVQILPIDSEHSAIFQCLSGNRKADLNRIFLTASGGPFAHRPIKDFKKITVAEALNHPTWQMGEKITVDSATLMNKGLEVLEAKHLFGVSHDMINVVIHPQSVIHSMVSYQDGSVIAQLGVPDMKTAISYAISYPERLPLNQPLLDFNHLGALTFEEPDFKKFPCLALAYAACETGDTLPAVLNAANEIAVTAFLDHAISFDKIPEMIQQVMDQHRVVAHPNLENIIAADQWAREEAKKWVASI